MLITLMRSYLRPYQRWIAAVVLLQAVQAACSLMLPAINADVLDRGVLRGDTGVIWSLGLVMLSITSVQIAFAIGAVYCGAKAAMGFGRDVRRDLFSRVLRYSTQEVNLFGPSSLITRITNDVQQVQMLVVLTCTMLLLAPMTIVGGVIMAMRQDIGLSWLVAVGVPALSVCLGLIVWRMLPQFTLMQERIDRVNDVVREQIIGVRVVRAFVREPEETHRFASVNRDLSETSLMAGRLMALMFPVMLLVLNWSSVAVLWFGAFRIDQGRMSVGSLVAFLTYFTIILSSVMMATFVVIMVPRAAVCASRIQEVLDTESSVVPPAIPVREVADAGSLELRNVGFKYPHAETSVLTDVSFRSLAGQTTAIIGSTGSGKTSLVNLVARLFDVTTGAVLIDGVDVRELDPEILWQRIGLVPQRPYLFTGTVASNLRYGKPDATDDDLWEALEVAQAADFVSAMPGGLDAAITQGGSNVSGGQRQRLSIARALVRRPEIYLFDDSFSALDLATDARLRAALVPFTREATIVLVAQRVSTISGADQIVVLEAGKVVGRGTHDELLRTSATYAEIVESQVRQEESVA